MASRLARIVVSESVDPFRRRRFALSRKLPFVLLISCVFLMLSTGATAAKTPTSSALQHVERTIKLVGGLRASVDRSQFDLDALLARLNYDDRSIIDFVAAEIVYQPYEGALRGPAGTLASRAGNTLDQALLLARLLRDAGFDARIARGAMSPGIQAELAENVRLSRSRVSPFTDSAAAKEILRQILALDRTRSPGETDAGALIDRAAQIAPEVLDEAERAAKVLAEVGMLSAPIPGKPVVDLTKALERGGYYWVQYRAGASSSWEDLHPAIEAVQSKAAKAVRPLQLYADSVPTEIQHRVRFEVFLEVRRGGKLERLPLMNAWERPSANFLDKPVEITNAQLNPDLQTRAFTDKAGFGSADFNDEIKVRAESGVFAPLFNGGLPPGARFFDMHGNLIDPMAGAASGADLFRTLSTKMRSAIGSMGGESSLPVTTGQIVRVTLVEPGGKETAYERYLFDRLNAAERSSQGYATEDDQTLRGSPLVDTAIAIVTGEIPEAKVIDLYLQQLETARSLFEWIARRPVSDGGAGDMEALDKALTKPLQTAASMRILSLIHLMDLPGRADFRSFRSRPNLIALTGKMAPGERAASGFFLVDIMDNHRTIVRESDGVIVHDRDRAISQGVWDTWSESLMFEPIHQDEPLFRRVSFDSTRSLRAKGAPKLVRLTHESQLVAYSDRIPAVSVPAIARDLALGHLVFLPTDEFGTKGVFTWWRLDPSTGTVLGMGWDGRGGFLEYLNTLGLGITEATAAARGVRGTAAWALCVWGSAAFKTAASGGFTETGPDRGFNTPKAAKDSFYWCANAAFWGAFWGAEIQALRYGVQLVGTAILGVILGDASR